MSRKIELTQMMLNSLMYGMSDDAKLVFLTEVFCLTEDMRYAISESGSNEREVQGDGSKDVSSTSHQAPRGTNLRKEELNEATGRICGKQNETGVHA